MNYANIKYFDVANGEGIRTSLFVSGCKNACKGCFNKCAWSFDYGDKYTPDIQKQILDSIDKPMTRGLSILGGDPMELENQETVLNLILAFREKFGSSKDIWLWTGYLYDSDLTKGGKRYIPEITQKILDNIDIIIDGPFIEDKKDLRLQWRGSSNQRVMFLRKELKTQE